MRIEGTQGATAALGAVSPGAQAIGVPGFPMGSLLGTPGFEAPVFSDFAQFNAGADASAFGAAAAACGGCAGAAMAGGAYQGRTGDWACPQCGNYNFARNNQCRRCATPCPGSVAAVEGAEAAEGEGGGCGKDGAKGGKKGKQWLAEPGDWTCPSCGDLNFRRNTNCRKCNTPRPEDAGGPVKGKGKGGKGGVDENGKPTGPMLKPGDWNCPGCGDLQFARNSACRRCGTPRPAEAGAPRNAGLPWFAEAGDWLCPGCGDLQFKRNSNCRKCGTPRPSEAEQAAAQATADAAAMLSFVEAQQQAAAYQMQLQEQVAEAHRTAMEQAAAIEAAAAAVAARAQAASPSMSALTAARLSNTIRISNLPFSMTSDNLVLTISGMFGDVTCSHAGIDQATSRPFAVIEFAEPLSAAKALATQRIQFGEDILEIVHSNVLANAPESEGGVVHTTRERSRSPRG
eukprot:TRINITY_DN11624_c0_g1_i1.p1 TRINITY_DN11624_c0_g1~~TRINITY_DN11624_c0_g1_i1.p1  ORF type:complete len:457 (+),score=113.79 TRINITY_DN11624_c0_g1_i1:200-1570(+)